MIKLLIVDDEPLVCVGIKSMIKWEEFDIEIVGTARNGVIALDLIEKLTPDIVISDIKMPLKTGLEIISECSIKYGRFPLFILLTSYEEFDFVREALKFQVVDYLIKPELTAEILSTSILKAINIYRDYTKTTPINNVQKNIQSMREKFFIRLYNNLFESPDQFNAQKTELGINFSSNYYVVVSYKIFESTKSTMSIEKLFSLCSSTSEIVSEVLNKEYKNYISILDIRRFSITLELNNENTNLLDILSKTISLAYSYFSVNLLVTVGSVVSNPYNLNESYTNAQKLFRYANNENPIVSYENGINISNSGFVFSEIKADLRQAFDEINTTALHDVLSKISDYYENNPNMFLEAIDTASNILYMIISLLPDGEKNISEIFSDTPDGYRCIYSYKSTSEIIIWIQKLRDGTCSILSSKRKDYKEQVVQNVKDYILSNIYKKLSLNDVAYVFNFNPNYLSHLFAKYSENTFVEFITKSKIDLAKEMLLEGDLRINEIAEKLSFENAFYFSKVFKKYVGVSPKNFQNRDLGGNNNET